MEELGACGLVCSECDAYVATKANDPIAIGKVAQEWSKMFASAVEPEHVWCDGCLSASDRKCGNCAVCGIRSCVVGRKLANCAGCDDYGCKAITEFFGLFPCAKEKLDDIRAASK